MPQPDEQYQFKFVRLSAYSPIPENKWRELASNEIDRFGNIYEETI